MHLGGNLVSYLFTVFIDSHSHLHKYLHLRASTQMQRPLIMHMHSFSDRSCISGILLLLSEHNTQTDFCMACGIVKVNQTNNCGGLNRNDTFLCLMDQDSLFIFCYFRQPLVLIFYRRRCIWRIELFACSYGNFLPEIFLLSPFSLGWLSVIFFFW